MAVPMLAYASFSCLAFFFSINYCPCSFAMIGFAVIDSLLMGYEPTNTI
jgi:hypothetical protein